MLKTLGRWQLLLLPPPPSLESVIKLNLPSFIPLYIKNFSEHACSTFIIKIYIFILKRNENTCPHKFYTNIHSGIICNGQKVGTTQTSINGCTDEQNVHIHKGVFFNHKKEQSTNISYDMDESWDSMKEDSKKRPQLVWFHLCEKTRRGSSTEKASILMMGRYGGLNSKNDRTEFLFRVRKMF